MADTEAIEEKAAIERVARWLSIEALETIQNDLNNDFGVGGNEDAMTRLRLAAVTAELAQRGHSPRSFVVETETEEGWKNVWAEDGEPMTFATLVEAESAMQAAYDDADGLILPGSMRVAGGPT